MKFKIKNWILTGIIFAALFLGCCILFEFKNNSMRLDDIKEKHNLLLSKYISLQEESELTQELIAQEITFDSLICLYKSRRINSNQKYKILIADISGCRVCLDNAVHYYKDIIEKRNLLDKVEIYLILRGANENAVKTVYRNYMKGDIAVFFDENDSFMKSHSLILTESIIMILNPRNICVFTYLIEQDMPQKHSFKLPVIHRIIEEKL